MKVLTIKSTETIPDNIQMDIHYSFRMEHHTDNVFRDEGATAYAVTISLEKTADAIAIIIKNSASFPDFTFMIDDLDMQKNVAERYEVKNGKVLDKKIGAWEWE